MPFKTTIVNYLSRQPFAEIPVLVYNTSTKQQHFSFFCVVCHKKTFDAKKPPA